MLRHISASLCITLFSLVALAVEPTDQERVADAYRQLQASQTAATQPAGISVGELAKLRAELSDLRAQLASLRAQNSRLNAEINMLKNADATNGANGQNAGGPSAANGSADDQAAIDKAISEHRIVDGMTVEQASKAVSKTFAEESASSDGEVYIAFVDVKEDKVGLGLGPNGRAIQGTAGWVGTKITLQVKDGRVLFWSSEPFNAPNGSAK